MTDPPEYLGHRQPGPAMPGLADLAAASPGAIIGKNLDGIVTRWDVRAERLFGYTAREIIGRPLLIIIPPDRQPEESAFLDRLRRGDRIDPYQTIRKTKAGRRIHLSIAISPVLEAGHVIEILTLIPG
jgi:PAS domain S-box-containing protein